MQLQNHFHNFKQKDRPVVLVLCLLISFILHLLVATVFHYQQKQRAELLSRQQEPTIVRLVERPQPKEKATYEIDEQPKDVAQEAPQTSRVAEANQQVEKETAPKGEDFRDQKVQQPSRTLFESTQTRQPQPQPQPQPETTPLPSKQDGRLPPPAKPSLPSLQKLTQLTPDTLSRIESSEKALQEKIKRRDDVESGDTVWLNLERGLLISFFRRFRNQIEGVWNYPQEAIIREEQGTLLLKITVAASGKLIDVELLESSGSDILDFEAIQAVYRAAPFGPLGKHYPYPDLKIMAHFHYHLTGKYIYGR